jgi:hypothetical protein
VTTHDYTLRYWGHDYVITEVINGGKTLKMMGWGGGLKKGHWLILPNNGDTTRYRISKIEYMNDPRDMWSAIVRFDPREGPLTTQPAPDSLLSALDLAVTSRKSLPCDNDKILVEHLLQAWNSGGGWESSVTPRKVRLRWVSGDLSGKEIELQRIIRTAVLCKDE